MCYVRIFELKQSVGEFILETRDYNRDEEGMLSNPKSYTRKFKTREEMRTRFTLLEKIEHYKKSEYVLYDYTCKTIIETSQKSDLNLWISSPNSQTLESIHKEIQNSSIYLNKCSIRINTILKLYCPPKLIIEVFQNIPPINGKDVLDVFQNVLKSYNLVVKQY